MLKDNILLKMENLHVQFNTKEGIVRALNGASLAMHSGETLGLVGESGCGKSVLARAIMGMVPRPGRILGGRILFQSKLHEGTGVIDLAHENTYKTRRGIRGREIGMIFQEPLVSFSPVHTIGNQIMESLVWNQGLDKEEATEQTLQVLERVGIPEPRRHLRAYPFQLSGGMRQRAMIAMALSCNPRLLIADEPTTALDVTTQAQILELLRRIQSESNMAILMITHDLGVVASVAHAVAVMYLGEVVEAAGAADIFHSPGHPYTKGLLASIPKVGANEGRLQGIAGTVPSSYTQVLGCPFHPRCSDRIDGLCNREAPETIQLSPGHWVKCHLYS